MKLFLRRQINKTEFFFCFLTNTVFFKKGSIWQKFELRASVFSAIGLGKSGQDTFLFKFFRDSRQFWNFF
jgi:hypothetical protein